MNRRVEMNFEKVLTGRGEWPKQLNRKTQKVIVLGLAAAERGVSLGRLQVALLEGAELAKTQSSVAGETSEGNTRTGLGYVDQWFAPSWVPKGCTVEKTEDFKYTVPSSRVRLIASSQKASDKLREARETVERHCLS
jgi:hypothetical protein